MDKPKQIAFDFDDQQRSPLPPKNVYVKNEPVNKQVIDLPAEITISKIKSTRGRKSLRK
jgi:hypothetical protein